MSNADTARIIGEPLDRVDGMAKVTGGARYAAEFGVRDALYAVLVQSTIPRGRITRFDVTDAERAPGVILVLTHDNAPRLPDGGNAAINPPAGRTLSLLQDDAVHYNGQPIAVVVADTFERATDASRLLRVSYAAAPAMLRFDVAKRSPHRPEKDGHSRPTWHGAMSAPGCATARYASMRIYTTPMEHHNPMEPHATVARWNGDRLTLTKHPVCFRGARDRRQDARHPARRGPRRRPFVGGGFGCKGSAWSHVVLAAMAASKWDGR